MKLIFCPKCEDLLKLNKVLRYCACRESWGFYNGDGLTAQIGGDAIPIGFNNASFASAIKNRPEFGLGREFTAFVIPEKCSTIERWEM